MLSIDVGFGNVKICDGETFNAFPAVYYECKGNYKHDKSDPNDLLMELDGIKYHIGQTAINNDGVSVMNRGDMFRHKLFILSAICVATEGDFEDEVLLGLPISDFEAVEADLKKLKGEYDVVFNDKKRHIKITKVRVFYQGKAVYEVVKDEDGNPVIDPITGEPKTQIVYEEVKDENGNVKLDDDGKPVKQIVYDMDKPIYNDPKGNTPLRPYRACEYVGTKVYHVNSAIRNWSDMPAESEWLDGYENDEYRLYNTTILQLQWKSDEDFIFRVYDTSGFSIGLPIIGDGFSLNMNGNIYSALGKDFKWYYWKNNRPCKKGEGRLNADPENQIILLLWPKKEVLELGTDENGNPITSEGWYLSALPLAKTWFKPSFIPDLIPTLLPLIKGLLN